MRHAPATQMYARPSHSQCAGAHTAVAVGAPRTRTVTVEADGLLETQLPELSIEQPPGIRQYADQHQKKQFRPSEALALQQATNKLIGIPSQACPLTHTCALSVRRRHRCAVIAALARVRRAGLLAGAPHHLSIAERLTLAALGLDEPPTEPEPFDVRDHPMAFPATADALREQIANEVEAMSSPLLEERVALSGVVLSAVAARIRSGPPAEPPKACPTCGSGWTYHHACPDRGSGIDGGTQR